MLRGYQRDPFGPVGIVDCRSDGVARDDVIEGAKDVGLVKLGRNDVTINGRISR